MSKLDKYSLLDLKKEFPRDRTCLEFIFNSLHSKNCSCGGKFSLMANSRRFQCSKCRYKIAPTSGTIFNKSSTPLTLWFYAIFIFSNAKSSISAAEMERQLGVTSKTAWRILHLIRKCLKQDDEKLQGIVEMDSAYIGATKHGNRLKSFNHKTIVTGAVEREGKMRVKIVGNTDKFNTEKFIKENIRLGSELMTDQAGAYFKTTEGYKWQSVNHSKKEFARGAVHVNTIDSFWGHFKRSINGTHKVISRKHLPSYIDAFVFHYNHRANSRERFGALLEAILKFRPSA